MRAELPNAVQGVSRGTLLVRALYVEGMYLRATTDMENCGFSALNIALPSSATNTHAMGLRVESLHQRRA